jgi:hypothetical protein
MFTMRTAHFNLRRRMLSWRISVTSGGDPGQNPKSRQANQAYANPAWRNMEQMCSDRKPHDKNDVSDHVHAE